MSYLKKIKFSLLNTYRSMETLYYTYQISTRANNAYKTHIALVKETIKEESLQQTKLGGIIDAAPSDIFDDEEQMKQSISDIKSYLAQSLSRSTRVENSANHLKPYNTYARTLQTVHEADQKVSNEQKIFNWVASKHQSKANELTQSYLKHTKTTKEFLNLCQQALEHLK